jgi:hypothetical protein
MWPEVQQNFRSFNETFEGSISYMYVDVKQLVTIGVGNLIDPIDLATTLPFKWKNKPEVAMPGALATADDITEEWNCIKNDPTLAEKGASACEPITNLELDDNAINSLIQQRLLANESYVKQVFGNWEGWPADAQMAVMSMAWAVGAAGVLDGFPKFCTACADENFSEAATECEISAEGNPGVVPRNQANKTLLLNAAVVIGGKEMGLKVDTLYYPEDLTEEED